MALNDSSSGPEALVVRKARESARLVESYLTSAAGELAACAGVLGGRFSAGGRLWTFGNGGSACDAAHLALEFVHPVIAKRPSLPAHCLAADAAVMTALGNDTDFSLVFAEQLRRLARPGDVAMGISTSGRSANVLEAFRAARELGLTSIGLTGGDGGRLPGHVDHLFVVPSHSIHRIQEVHVALLHVIWDLVHLHGGHDDVL